VPAITAFYSVLAALPLRPDVLISPPLVSLLRLTICSRGSGGALTTAPAAAVFVDTGLSFSAPTPDCLRRETASVRRPCLALGRREDDDLRLSFASILARELAASREGGREAVRAIAGELVLDCNAAKEVDERASAGGLLLPLEGGMAPGSSAKSHIPVLL
jgi:hypothetical protein